MPSISVVMPARNAGATIESAVMSVLQAPEVEELLVMENWSTDNTAEVLAGISDPRLKVFDKPEEKFPATITALMNKATCPYLACCDSDDLYAPDRLGRQIAWLEEHPDYVATSAAYTTMDEAGRPIAKLANDGVPRDVTDQMRNGKAGTHFATFVYRTATIHEIGGIRGWFLSASDLDLMYRVAGAGKVWHDPTLMAFYYRLLTTSVTRSQTDRRRKFYDDQARLFALQRLETGQDDLMRGTAPAPPEETAGEERARKVSEIAAGQLEGRAWNALRNGHKREATNMILRAALQEPWSPRRWYGAVALLFRAAFR